MELSSSLQKSIFMFLLMLDTGIIFTEGEPVRINSYLTKGNRNTKDIHFLKKIPCPDPKEIYPCTCFFNKTQGCMDMDCSSVTSEDELRTVFSKDFPFTAFTNLFIRNNKNIKSLRDGDLGKASFEKIFIENGALTEVQDAALAGSHDTLIELYITSNKLMTVPTLSVFSQLELFYLDNNNLTKFPLLASKTLRSLSLTSNNIKEVPTEATESLPLLRYLYLDYCSLQEIHPETFKNNAFEYLNLNGNKLTTLPWDALNPEEDLIALYLAANEINHLSYEAVSSVTGILDVSHNNMTELPETVFKPLIERNAILKIWNNPFKCGCDIAWLILNQTLLHSLPDLDNDDLTPKCSDGEDFTNLDPAIYEMMCHNVTVL